LTLDWRQMAEPRLHRSCSCWCRSNATGLEKRRKIRKWPSALGHHTCVVLQYRCEPPSTTCCVALIGMIFQTHRPERRLHQSRDILGGPIRVNPPGMAWGSWVAVCRHDAPPGRRQRGPGADTVRRVCPHQHHRTTRALQLFDLQRLASERVGPRLSCDRVCHPAFQQGVIVSGADGRVAEEV
jgi:hypothetical protein